MNKIELNKDTIKYFHFTTTKALESIDEKGLLALIGDNSRGVEKTHKVFFSESLENAARCLDVWVRWRIVHSQKTNDRQEYLNKALKDFVPQEELVVDDKGENTYLLQTRKDTLIYTLTQNYNLQKILEMVD